MKRRIKGQQPDPTPEEIAERCAEIRKTWSWWERVKRGDESAERVEVQRMENDKRRKGNNGT